jgi:hypothetical protein
VEVRNNVLDGVIAARDGAAATVAGNYANATAALFVNPVAGDLHLLPSAAAVLNQVATILAGAAVDWDGDPRPAGTADIGADEYQSGSGALPHVPQNLRIVSP